APLVTRARHTIVTPKFRMLTRIVTTVTMVTIRCSLLLLPISAPVPSAGRRCTAWSRASTASAKPVGQMRRRPEMRAELYIDPLSDGEPTDRVVTLACRCARTTLVFLGNGVGLPAAWLIRLAVERHRAE